MKKILILLTLITGPAQASQYAVQLEASKSPNLDRYKDLTEHGRLYTVAADHGYTRTRLGPYENKSKALDVLDKVHAAGYTDAFIAKQQNGDTTSSVSSSMKSPASKYQYDIENFDVRTLKEWKMLTPEQQANLVYLDGVLHVKNGNKFIPLDEITGHQ